MDAKDGVDLRPETSRTAETVLRRLGYSRVTPSRREASIDAAFWVKEHGVERNLPVFIEGSAPRIPEAVLGWMERPSTETSRSRRAIVVVPTDREAEEAWRRYGGTRGETLDRDLSILVVPQGRSESAPHWHARIVPRGEVLRLATGVVVGMFRVAQASAGPSSIDFELMLHLIRERFGVDVHGSLGVRSDEDALYLIYQMASKDAYAPGDPAPNLHTLVLKPSGPAARLPWFAG